MFIAGLLNKTPDNSPSHLATAGIDKTQSSTVGSTANELGCETNESIGQSAVFDDIIIDVIEDIVADGDSIDVNAWNTYLKSPRLFAF